MASEPFSTEPSFDIREQAARIDQALANAAKMREEAAKVRDEAVKVRLDTRLAPWAVLFTGLGAGAALFAAGAAFMKLISG